MIAINPSTLKTSKINCDFNRQFLFHLAGNLMNSSELNWPLYFLHKPCGEILLGWGSIYDVKVTGRDRVSQTKRQIDEIEKKIKDKKSLPPWLGGISFFEEKDEKTSKENIWSTLPESVFFLPKYFFRFKDNQLTFQAFGQANEQETLERILKKVEAIAFDKANLKEETEQWLEVSSSESEKQWHEAFKKLEPELINGNINKVVLSRKKTYHSKTPVSFSRVWYNFTKIDASQSYQFAFLWQDNLFIGSTPETLFSINQASVSVPAIAGTRPRGKDANEDFKLAQNLLSSQKEQEEHGYVVDYIKDKLQVLGEVLVPKAPVILKLPFLQHLFTNHILHPKTSVHALDLLQSLHPTPAMAGVPKKDAICFLQKAENYWRGYYASPLGYFYSNTKDACFVVAIRSALLQKQKFHVFAGAGIVKDSKADQEWNETENKMQTMAQVVTG